MAQTYELRDNPADDPVVKSLTKSLQSGHINLLLGAGASHPAIPLAGNVEVEIDTLLQAGNTAAATQKMYELLHSIQSPLNGVIAGTPNAECVATLDCYRHLLRSLERILSERRTTVLPRQATIFTTNYDVLIDIAAQKCEAATVANGFDRALVSDEPAEYSSRRFFLTTFDTGNLYEYRVELPALNLVKLHGCVSWTRDTDRILTRQARRDLPPAGTAAASIQTFVESYAVILPQAGKFNTTVLDRTYYELLRLYANALDKENALLIAFGFSFRDEHILHITRRALKNPTLRVLALAYDMASRQSLETIFTGHNNVIVVAVPAPDSLDFARFNKLLTDASPKG
jgi:hypothetical protein